MANKKQAATLSRNEYNNSILEYSGKDKRSLNAKVSVLVHTSGSIPREIFHPTSKAVLTFTKKLGSNKQEDIKKLSPTLEIRDFTTKEATTEAIRVSREVYKQIKETEFEKKPSLFKIQAEYKAMLLAGTFSNITPLK